MVRLAQQGRIETIMSHKTTLDLNSLLVTEQPLVLLPPPPPPRVVLIEGAPGGGKSTLAFYICKQWVEGASFLSKFDIVVIAYLRDQAIQNAGTLADILPADAFKMSQMVANQIKRSCGHQVLFIFDGWDEFPYHLQNDSLVSTIIRNPQKLSLHKSTVLITSRPVSSGNLFNFVNRRVEILGFTQHQIREYIEKALDGNSTHVQKLVQHLENHPVIEGYCYIPLHAAILVHVFLTMNEVLPTTLHELFCSLVLCCIVRELETHDSKQMLPELSSLNDLPGDLKSQLSHLCVLAYEGVMQNKVVFYQKDLQATHIPANLPSLGILQAVEGLTLYSKSLSYNFLHLSVQELLAAYHISQMNPSKQLEIFKHLLESPRFQPVLQYYSGFTKLDNSRIRGFISAHTQKKSLLKILPFLHCFFEAQQTSLCLLVDQKLRTAIILEQELNPGDFSAIGYFITSLLTNSVSDTPIHLIIHNIEISSHHLKLLLSEISKCSIRRISTTADMSGTLVMEFCKTIFAENEAKVIASCLQSSPAAISELLIHDGYIQPSCEDGLLHLAVALQTNFHLSKLQLSNLNLHCKENSGAALTKMLQRNKSLIHLELSNNRSFSDLGACCIFQGLQHNTTLVHLDLSYSGISTTEATVQSLSKMLQENKSLTHLNLSGNFLFSDLGAHCIFEGLQHNTTLIHLNLSSTRITDEGALYIANLLDSNHSLQMLNISLNLIGNDGFAYIAKSLRSNSTLKKLEASASGKEQLEAVQVTRQNPIDMVFITSVPSY